MTERKHSKTTEKSLAETGALLSDIDEQVRFDTLSDRVEGLIDVLDRLGARLEKLDEKFEVKLESVLNKLDSRITSTSERVQALHLDLTKLEERVKVLSDAHERSWVNTVTKLVDNKHIRMGGLLLIGYVAREFGVPVWEGVVKIFGGS